MGHGIIEGLRFLWDCVLGVIYCGDDKCILCTKDIYEDRIICRECEGHIKFCKDVTKVGIEDVNFDCYSVSYYSGAMMELILKLKYKSSFRSGDIIARYMHNLLSCKNIDFDFITYVPMTKESFKKRGYNQSEYLAKVLGKAVNRPVIPCLHKNHATKDQIGLSGRERWNNMYGSFSIYNKISLKNKNILLIDDVVTTGATAFYCCCELIKNGAEKIIILTGAKSRV